MKKGNKGKIIAIALLLIAALAVNIACSTLNPMITSFMGANLNPLLTGKKNVESAEILSVADATEQSLRMAEALESEGIVLLRNENGALPLAKGTKRSSSSLTPPTLWSWASWRAWTPACGWAAPARLASTAWARR